MIIRHTLSHRSGIWIAANNGAVYKSGTGTRGQGHRDASMGHWDLGTRDEGLEDIKYGTLGRVGRGRGDVKYRDAGCEWLSQKLEVNAISLSSRKCVIYDSIFQNNVGHLMMFTQNISLLPQQGSRPECEIPSASHFIYRLNTKIRLTMLCLSGFELYSRWVPLETENVLIKAV